MNRLLSGLLFSALTVVALAAPGPKSGNAVGSGALSTSDTSTASFTLGLNFSESKNSGKPSGIFMFRQAWTKTKTVWEMSLIKKGGETSPLDGVMKGAGIAGTLTNRAHLTRVTNGKPLDQEGALTLTYSGNTAGARGKISWSFLPDKEKTPITFSGSLTNGSLSVKFIDPNQP